MDKANLHQQYNALFAPSQESRLSQFVPLMAVVACISTYFYHKTGKIYTGAFINALFITWYIVAGQAIHFPM